MRVNEVVIYRLDEGTYERLLSRDTAGLINVHEFGTFSEIGEYGFLDKSSTRREFSLLDNPHDNGDSLFGELSSDIQRAYDGKLSDIEWDVEKNIITTKARQIKVLSSGRTTKTNVCFPPQTRTPQLEMLRTLGPNSRSIWERDE